MGNSTDPVGWQRGIWGKLKDIEAQNDSILSILTLLARLRRSRIVGQV